MERKNKGLSAWQLAMLALGTVVGGSFFLGSSVAIKAAGPAVLLSYVIGGVLVYFILTALSEMTVANPVSGSFRTYTEQAFGQGAGFTVGWVYWTGLVLAMSSEATAASILLRGWFSWLSLPLTGSLIIVGVTLVNLLGAEKLGKLESGLAAVKLLAIGGFIVIALGLAIGIGTGAAGPVGFSVLRGQNWFPGGIGGIAGSMLIVMFTYAGFEVIGLAASEAPNPAKTIPRAINLTIMLLVGLYIIAVASLFLLIPAAAVNGKTSPFVSALSRFNLSWAGTLMNLVLVSAILSTMLASVFGLGRMIRSLADEGHTPAWMKDRSDVPYRGILISGGAMLLGLGLGLLLPQNVYLFLVGSGGFSLLFAYVMIMASHYKLRKSGRLAVPKRHGMFGYPITSWIAMVSLVAILISMPLVPGQGSGLVAGISFVLLFVAIYAVKWRVQSAGRRRAAASPQPHVFSADRTGSPRFANAEAAEELAGENKRGPYGEQGNFKTQGREKQGNQEDQGNQQDQEKLEK